jgi:hypothetical protein
MVYGFCKDPNFCWVHASYVKNDTRVTHMGHHIEDTAYPNFAVKALKPWHYFMSDLRRVT